MNDLNFAGLIAARQAATQARQSVQPQERGADPLDPRSAASAFDAAMARASRDESRRSAEALAESRRARQPEPPRNGEAKSPTPAPRDTQPARNTMAERTRPEESSGSQGSPGEGDNAAPQVSKAGAKPAKTNNPNNDAQNPQDACASALPVAAAPVQSIVDIPATQDAAAVSGTAVGAAQAGVGAVTQPIAEEPDLESLSTVIRSDDPLADSRATPRGLARALPPDETAAARPAKSAVAPAHAAGEPAHAAPFERVIEASQRDGAMLRQFSAGSRAAGATEGVAAARIDGAVGPNAAVPMFAQTGAAPTTYSVAHGSVSTPVGQPAFAEEFAQRVVIFSSQKIHSAQIALTPAELGPIAISIEMRGQEAHLNFAAAHATTRAAIEDALPRLREMFSASGLQLAGAQVGDQPAQRDYGRARRGGESAIAGVGGSASSGGPDSSAGIDTQAMRTQWLRSDRLIDIVV